MRAMCTTGKRRQAVQQMSDALLLDGRQGAGDRHPVRLVGRGKLLELAAQLAHALCVLGHALHPLLLRRQRRHQRRVTTLPLRLARFVTALATLLLGSKEVRHELLLLVE